MSDESGTPASGIPARGYKWAPFTPGNDVGRQFEPGNSIAERHGAYSPRKVDPLASELVDRVLSETAGVGHLQRPEYRLALWAWGRAEAQVQLLTEWLAKRGEETEDGVGDLGDEKVRAAYLLLHRAEARANTMRTRLGLDPLSRARLGRDVAAGELDAARLMAEMERREQERGRTGGGDAA